MIKAKAFFLLCFIVIFTAALFAQEEADNPENSINGEIPLETDWYGELPPLYSMGDKTFTISLGLIFPTLFYENGQYQKLSNMSVIGGAGCLSFNYFLDSNFFIGGEIGGQFNSTIADNMLYIIPIGFRGGCQFLIWKMEIPISLAIGIAPQTYLDFNYLGFFAKGGIATYFRFNPDWSFGLNFSWTWVPQWKQEPKENANGNFINLFFAARYHF